MEIKCFFCFVFVGFFVVAVWEPVQSPWGRAQVQYINCSGADWFQSPVRRVQQTPKIQTMASVIDLKCKTPVMHYTDEDVCKILAKYDRKPDALHKDVEVIRKWLKGQPHIPLEPSDRQIVSFLIMNKFSIERTKEKLDINYTIKSLIPEYFAVAPTHPEYPLYVKKNTWCMLPKLSKDLNRVYVWRCEDPEDFSVLQLYSQILLTLEIRTIADFSNSDEYIADYSNVTMGVFARISPMDVKKVTTILEKVYSNRIAAINFLKLPSYGETFLNICKAALKKKIADRIQIHKTPETLLKRYSKEMLPKDYGGDEKPLSELKEDLRAYLVENNDYLEETQKARVREELRPVKLQNDDVLGFHGNFRKLEVD